MEILAFIILRPFITSSLHTWASSTSSEMMRYWVAFDQARMTKGGIRIFAFASHRSKGNNIFISLSRTVECQVVLCFRTLHERTEWRGNGTSVAHMRLSEGWIKIDCRRQGVCQREPGLCCGCAELKKGMGIFLCSQMHFVLPIPGFSPSSYQWNPLCKRTGKGWRTQKVYKAVPLSAYMPEI